MKEVMTEDKMFETDIPPKSASHQQVTTPTSNKTASSHKNGKKEMNLQRDVSSTDFYLAQATSYFSQFMDFAKQKSENIEIKNRSPVIRNTILVMMNNKSKNNYAKYDTDIASISP